MVSFQLFGIFIAFRGLDFVSLAVSVDWFLSLYLVTKFLDRMKFRMSSLPYSFSKSSCSL
jgi:hypothetical protein